MRTWKLPLQGVGIVLSLASVFFMACNAFDFVRTTSDITDRDSLLRSIGDANLVDKALQGDPNTQLEIAGRYYSNEHSGNACYWAFKAAHGGIATAVEQAQRNCAEYKQMVASKQQQSLQGASQGDYPAIIQMVYDSDLDKPQRLMWAELASRSGDWEFIQYSYPLIKNACTPGEIEKGQLLATEWAQSHPGFIETMQASFKKESDRRSAQFQNDLAAAQRGDDMAYTLVSQSYMTGHGVKQDKVQAIMWFKRAYPHLDVPQVIKIRPQMAPTFGVDITAEEINQGVQLAQEWLSKHPR